ncbi:hypothetical protein [Pantoea septica]|uniref:hypothetical protein n=1 Tax=Pantoea septica TaxID=472695 RepID=UPI001C111269|nr:hypothetical protein [Pantoea septica]MBU5379510.1 hypothetical protein [Pantoea septica]
MSHQGNPNTVTRPDPKPFTVKSVILILLMQALYLAVGILIVYFFLNGKITATTEVPKSIEFLLNLFFNFKFVPWVALASVMAAVIYGALYKYLKHVRFNHPLISYIITIFSMFVASKCYTFSTLIYYFYHSSKQVPFFNQVNAYYPFVFLGPIVGIALTCLYVWLWKKLSR